MIRVVQVVQRVDKGGVPSVDGALGTSELAEVVRDVLEQHPDHEHAKEGRQNDVHPHQLAQKAAEQFDTESAWSADWSQMEPSVKSFNIFDLKDKSIFYCQYLSRDDFENNIRYKRKRRNIWLNI